MATINTIFWNETCLNVLNHPFFSEVNEFEPCSAHEFCQLWPMTLDKFRCGLCCHSGDVSLCDSICIYIHTYTYLSLYNYIYIYTHTHTYVVCEVNSIHTVHQDLTYPTLSVAQLLSLSAIWDLCRSFSMAYQTRFHNLAFGLM